MHSSVARPRARRNEGNSARPIPTPPLRVLGGAEESRLSGSPGPNWEANQGVAAWRLPGNHTLLRSKIPRRFFVNVLTACRASAPTGARMGLGCFLLARFYGDGAHDHMKTSQTQSPTGLHGAQSVTEHTILESRSLENIHPRFVVQRLNRKKRVTVRVLVFLNESKHLLN